ncbi:MAG TPA: glycine oxidase ThiO [Arenibaculum sp.]|nr:glycine oxidase ThiO [Arenibaculum sp.]
MPVSSSPTRPSVAIVGAGVIGLGIAWRLASAGCRVEVFDRGTAGSGASRAAAGMLAAGVETEPGEDALLRLNLLSQGMWPAFAAELEAASGMSVDLRSEGTLVVALNADDVGRLRFNHRLQQEAGIDIRWLTGSQAREREPFLSPRVTAALFSPNDHQVDNRKLGHALLRAATKAGAVVRERCPVDRIAVEAGRAHGVVAGGTLHAADVVVLAAGAWSRLVEGLPDAERPQIRPIKGQMLALRMSPDEPLLRHVVWAPGAYLVPRLDGQLIVGATVEERGFDETMTAGGLLALLDGVWRVLPGVEELPVVETWVGFRPGSRDDAPILGPGRIGGLVLATGHHRNGILLTPITADAVSRAILTGTVPDEIAAFGPARFAVQEET